jgi:predicted nuclease of restriction endonuclease-like (RecB) superfamily
MNMKRFFNDYQHLTFLQSLPAEFKDFSNISPSTNVIELQNCFFGISFTHHLVILIKCKTFEERFFYMHQAATNFWSVSLLEEKVVADIKNFILRMGTGFCFLGNQYRLEVAK